MAADPTLADQIIEWLAKYPPDDDDRIIKLNFEIGKLRATAVRLRKLDAIEEAIGDVETLREGCRPGWNDVAYDEIDTLLRRIADALGGTEN